MTKYPNREALRKAHDIYRDAMREFVVRCLKKIRGTTPEEVIGGILNPELIDDPKIAIDITDFPRIIRDHSCWVNAFSQLFGSKGAMDIRGMASVIGDGRKWWAHPGIEDTDSESTRTHLSPIADVLGGINEIDAKYEVETIRDRLFSNEVEEHPLEAENAALKENLADMTKQLEAVKAEKIELEKQVKTTSDRLEEVEAEWIACDESLAAVSNQLATTSNRLKNVEKENAAYQKRIEAAEAEKTKYEKTFKAASNQLAILKKEKAQLEECLEITSTQLEDVKEELADFEAEVEEPRKKEPDPIPATEFPYTGSQLRDFRTKAGLTQVAVAVQLGMKGSSSSAIGDWEAELLKVPPKHYAKLKELYGLDDNDVFSRYPTNTAKSPRYQRKWRQPGAVAALRDPAEIREAEVKIAKIRNPSEKTRLERELREAKRSVDSS